MNLLFVLVISFAFVGVVVFITTGEMSKHNFERCWVHLAKVSKVAQYPEYSISNTLVRLMDIECAEDAFKLDWRWMLK